MQEVGLDILWWCQTVRGEKLKDAHELDRIIPQRKSWTFVPEVDKANFVSGCSCCYATSNPLKL